MITLGIILLVIAMLMDVSVLFTVGGILVVVGAILWLLGALDRGIGGRAHYY